MLRDFLLWSAAGLPVAAGLVAIAAVPLSSLGAGQAGLGGAAVFLVIQTCVPIALWVLAERRVPWLGRGWRAPLLLFPFVVALVGILGVAAIGEWAWPRDSVGRVLSVVGWLGFAWSLLVARAVVRHLVPTRA